MAHEKKGEAAPQRSKGTVRTILLGAGFVVVFALGIGIGNGTVTFGTGLDPVAKGLPENLDYTEVENVYDNLRRSFDGQLDQQKLLEGLKSGMVGASGDEYTEYLSPEEAKDFNEELSGTFSGIGAELGKKDDNIVIVAPLSGFPAEKAGLRSGDVIIQIDGESTHGLSVTEAVDKIRGTAGTKVKLKVIRDKAKELDFEITRATITIPSVEWRVEDGNIGYMQVSRFSDDTYALAQKAANEFKAKKVKGVVLDLRNDPGGLLEQAVELSGLWLPKGKTVLQEKRDGVISRTYDSKGPATLGGIHTVVLINEGSASASEITAGALKDNGVVILMGEKSFGKGSVQTLEDLPDGGVLKVTIARWYTPAGKNIDKEGINPDKKVKLTEEDAKNNRDPQLDAAVKSLQK